MAQDVGGGAYATLGGTRLGIRACSQRLETLDTHFTRSTAWEFIADRLERGKDMEVFELRNPKWNNEYVIKSDLGPDERELYIKLELGSGKVFGHSFHCSKFKRED